MSHAIARPSGMAREWDERIGSLAAAQHGVVGRWQLRELGLDSGAIGRRIRSGALVVESKRALRLRGAPTTALSQAMAGQLEAGPGAVVSHGSAAAIWEVPGFGLLPVEVTGRRGRLSPGTYELAIVHQPRRLETWHWVELDGLRVTTPTRTLFDLAGLPWVHPQRLERALDTLWAKGRVDDRSLNRMLACLAAKGRRGIVVMRALIEARGGQYRPPESGAEGRFRQLAESWGWRHFERQLAVGDEDRWIGRVDFVDRGYRIVVEIDPSRFHSSLTDVAHDRARRRSLEAAGWTVVSVTEADLFHRPDELRRTLEEVRRRAA